MEWKNRRRSVSLTRVIEAGDDGRPEIPAGQGNASKPQQRLYPLMDPIRSWKPRLLVAIT